MDEDQMDILLHTNEKIKTGVDDKNILLHLSQQSTKDNRY